MVNHLKVKVASPSIALTHQLLSLINQVMDVNISLLKVILKALDLEGNEITGELADKYQLKKEAE
ncbi:Uncharacterised protein [Acinetobacter haemolyticus]|nr:Uncharacterised protein [Acinetobacter haemolyticus]